MDHQCDLKPDAPECMHRGHVMLFPGYYVCADNHNHIVAPEVLRFLGLPVNPENLGKVEGFCRRYFKKHKDKLLVMP
jgi:hypothetical protein